MDINKVTELLEMGFTREQIVEMLGNEESYSKEDKNKIIEDVEVSKRVLEEDSLEDFESKNFDKETTKIEVSREDILANIDSDISQKVMRAFDDEAWENVMELLEGLNVNNNDGRRDILQNYGLSTSNVRTEEELKNIDYKLNEIKSGEDIVEFNKLITDIVSTSENKKERNIFKKVFNSLRGEVDKQKFKNSTSEEVVEEIVRKMENIREDVYNAKKSYDILNTNNRSEIIEVMKYLTAIDYKISEERKVFLDMQENKDSYLTADIMDKENELNDMLLVRNRLDGQLYELLSSSESINTSNKSANEILSMIEERTNIVKNYMKRVITQQGNDSKMLGALDVIEGIDELRNMLAVSEAENSRDIYLRTVETRYKGGGMSAETTKQISKINEDKHKNYNKLMLEGKKSLEDKNRNLDKLLETSKKNKNSTINLLEEYDETKR